MNEIKFLKWLSGETNSSWWHDSADPDELRAGIENGASGATTRRGAKQNGSGLLKTAWMERTGNTQISSAGD